MSVELEQAVNRLGDQVMRLTIVQLATSDYQWANGVLPNMDDPDARDAWMARLINARRMVEIAGDVMHGRAR